MAKFKAYECFPIAWCRFTMETFLLTTYHGNESQHPETRRWNNCPSLFSSGSRTLAKFSFICFNKLRVFIPCSTFGMVDSEETCLVVMVYNTADTWGVLIGDSVVIPEPNVKRHSIAHKDKVSMSPRHVSSFTLGSVGLTSPCLLCDSRTTLKAYGWTLRCYSSSTASYRTPKVRSPSPSATSTAKN